MAVDLGQPIEDFTVGAMQGYRGGDPDGDVGRVLPPGDGRSFYR